MGKCGSGRGAIPSCPKTGKTVTQICGLNYPSSPRVGELLAKETGRENPLGAQPKRQLCLFRLSDFAGSRWLADNRYSSQCVHCGTLWGLHRLQPLQHLPSGLEQRPSGVEHLSGDQGEPLRLFLVTSPSAKRAQPARTFLTGTSLLGGVTMNGLKGSPGSPQ